MLLILAITTMLDICFLDRLKSKMQDTIYVGHMQDLTEAQSIHAQQYKELAVIRIEDHRLDGSKREKDVYFCLRCYRVSDGALGWFWSEMWSERTWVLI